MIDKSSFAAQKMILGGPRGDKNYVRTDRVQITKKMTDSMEQLRNSLKEK